MKFIKNQCRNRLGDGSLDSTMRIIYRSQEDVVECINSIVRNKTLGKERNNKIIKVKQSSNKHLLFIINYF